MELYELRQQIDRIDSELLSLLEKRMDAARKIARFKRDHGMQVFDPEREAEMMAGIPQKIKDIAYLEYAKGLILFLTEVSKAEQQKVLNNE